MLTGDTVLGGASPIVEPGRLGDAARRAVEAVLVHVQTDPDPVPS